MALEHAERKNGVACPGDSRCAGGLAGLSLKLGFRADARKTALKHRERLSRFARPVCGRPRLQWSAIGPASLASHAWQQRVLRVFNPFVVSRVSMFAVH